jgi:hypothetical protein
VVPFEFEGGPFRTKQPISPLRLLTFGGNVVSKADEYRAKAEECERQAASAHNHLAKTQFKDLAA